MAYPDALSFMESYVSRIRAENAPDLVWLLEHPPLYTAGTSARAADLLKRDLPVYTTGRGGQYTYHGPGQRVAYAMVDLQRRFSGLDLRRYVHDLEDWVISALCRLGVAGERREGRVGIWVRDAAGIDLKIAALGIRVRRGVAYHGVALNVAPDLSHFSGIVPCGLAQYGVTSLRALGVLAGMQDVDEALQEGWNDVFA